MGAITIFGAKVFHNEEGKLSFWDRVCFEMPPPEASYRIVELQPRRRWVHHDEAVIARDFSRTSTDDRKRVRYKFPPMLDDRQRFWPVVPEGNVANCRPVLW